MIMGGKKKKNILCNSLIAFFYKMNIAVRNEKKKETLVLKINIQATVK